MSTNAKNNKDSLQEFGEAYYNSQSEGREEVAEHFFQDYQEVYDNYIQETAKETFGQYYHSPEAQGGWFSIKEKALRDYQGYELTED